MARKKAETLVEKSWAVVGIDTSMSSVAIAMHGYDATTNKEVRAHTTLRWIEEDYFERLKQCAYIHNLMLDVFPGMWAIPMEQIYIGVEEPIYYGAVGAGQSSAIKQQCEVCGAVKSALLRFGYVNMLEVNNSKWHAMIRKDGAKLRKGLNGKMDVKKYAMVMLQMPDYPDLVKSKSGAKIPRPESGYGARARAVQPEDVYDAAVVCEWTRRECAKLGLIPA